MSEPAPPGPEIVPEPPGIAYTIKIHQRADGNLAWENPTNDPRQLERVLLQALAHLQRELIAVRCADLVVQILNGPRIVRPGPPPSPLDLRGR